MKYDQFVGQVQHRARLPDKAHAVTAIRATLETLASRLTFAELKDLAAQLPQEIAIYLQPKTMPAQRFSLKEFFERVSENEAASIPDATYHARVVFEVLMDAVSRGEMADVRAQLPAEYEALFQGSAGKLHA